MHDALYESRFSELADVPQPKAVSADIALELWPRERRMRYAAELILENRTDRPVTQLELEADDFTRITCVTETDGCTAPALVDAEYRRYRYALATPLQPTEQRSVRIEAVGQYAGYGKEGSRGPVLRQGSFVTDEAWPVMGYDRGRELTLTGDRRFHGLPPRTPVPPPTEAHGVGDFAISSQGDLLDYELTITTDTDQTAVAPGALVSTERGDGRVTYRYRGRDALWSFLVASAAYTTQSTRWDGGASDPIEITVHHLPNHDHNVPRFLAAAQAALDRLVPVFGPPPHSQLRIVEVPQFLAEKTRTAGNVIAMPEKDGWLHDYRRDPGRDWILYTVAREISRMWWGQRVAPGEMQGSVLLAESVPEYLALRVVEEVNGVDEALDLLAMKRDIYLRQRVKEDQMEQSLLHADGERFADEKGLLALFAARSILGRDRLDAALAAYAERASKRTQPPYANAAELLNQLASFAETQPARDDLVATFTRTSLYDFRVRSAQLLQGAQPARLRLEIEADRFDVTEHSNHAATPFSRSVPVAILGDGMSIGSAHFATLHLVQGRNVATLELPFRPTRVSIDPFARFVDLNIRDNSRPVQP